MKRTSILIGCFQLSCLLGANAGIEPSAVDPSCFDQTTLLQSVAKPSSFGTTERVASSEVATQGIRNQVYMPLQENTGPLANWTSVAKAVPEPKVGDWMSETLFLERLLRSFGKQRADYNGSQTMGGFKPGTIFDENGMFAFEDSVRSVAIDVGAASNPLMFDLDIDSTQVAFYVEPLQWKGLENAVENDAKQVKLRGGCATRWEGLCTMHRFNVFPAAVSNQLGHANFHATANPYCGSLSSFSFDMNKSSLDDNIQKSEDSAIRTVFEQCYKDAGTSTDIATISLKGILERIPKHIAVKYVKIDAQGQDFKVLLSAGDQIERIEYVRFETQVDPPPGRQLVKDAPSYADLKAKLDAHGF